MLLAVNMNIPFFSKIFDILLNSQTPIDVIYIDCIWILSFLSSIAMDYHLITPLIQSLQSIKSNLLRYLEVRCIFYSHNKYASF